MGKKIPFNKCGCKLYSFNTMVFSAATYEPFFNTGYFDIDFQKHVFVS